MRKLIFAMLMAIPFFCCSQTNKQDSFVHSFTSNGYLSGDVFVGRVAVITVDFYDMEVSVMGSVHKFSIVSKDVFGDDTLTVIRYSDTGELASLTENKKRGGFYSYYAFTSKLYFETAK